MINLLPVARPDVISKILQVARVRLDRMRGGIPLAQHAQKLVRGFLNPGALATSSAAHIVTTAFSPQRHGGTEKTRIYGFLKVLSLVPIA